MRAAVFHEYGPSSVLRVEEVPKPEVGPEDVLVRVRAVSVNRSTDVAIRAGRGQFRVPLPHILGIDPAGEVAEIGSAAQGFEVGERVVVQPKRSCRRCEFCLKGLENLCGNGGLIGIQAPGGYAEYISVPARNLVRIPENISFEEASALIAMMPIAWHLLVARAELTPGERVLIMAAGGSLGCAGLQIAKLAGAWVIAAAGADWKLERSRALGADATINYSEKKLSEEVKRLTGGRGVDVVFENISSPELFPESINSLASRGRLVTAGTHGGSGRVEVNMTYLYRKHLSIIGGGGSPIHELETVWRLIAEGKLKATIYRTFPLEQAAEAHDLIDSRNIFGRVVLTV